MRAINLKTEYLSEPMGMDIINPRFSWNCDGGKLQSAYRIVATKDGEVQWDSGKEMSPSMTNISYEGPQLNSRDHIEWSVCLWDEKDEKGEESTSWFEMGLLSSKDWKAKWIAGDYSPKKNTRYPVDCFKRNFSIKKQIQKARIYITACGLYEAFINGNRVGDFCLAPGSTDYRRRIQYQTYDVTNLIKEGPNNLVVWLADGWYRGSIGCFAPTNVFGRVSKLMCQLELLYTDGSEETISSDEKFSWSNDGPIRFADLKDGETYDASMCPSYKGRVRIVKEKITPTASNNVIPKEQEVFTPTLLTTPSGKKVLDFGQNIAGFLAFKVKGKRGQKITLLCGEILDENKEFTQKNIHTKIPAKEAGFLTQIQLVTGNADKIKGEMTVTPKQRIEFICSGETDQYKMSFSVFGFQYALIETDVEINPADFKAIAVYSDMEQTGEFECSNEKVNQFFNNTKWSMKGNFLDVPTDCPTRERLAWTGDAQIFFNTAAYLMNVAPFFRKWMRDVRDGQFKDGRSSAVVPYNGMDIVYKNTGASVGWGEAVVLVPYRYWKRYGDIQILKDCYDLMHAYAIYMIRHTGHKNKKAASSNPYNKYTYEKGMHLGEWLEPEEFRDAKIGGGVLHTEECTAYLHYTMRHMAEVAKVLGKAEDESLFTEYAKGAAKAYDHLFLQSGTIDTDRQAKLVRPLALGLLDTLPNKKEKVQQRLLQAIKNRNYRIGTGFLSTPFVLPVLTKAGYLDEAYKMLENEEAPSWLAEVKAGATTVWEDWEGSVSRNHYSPGSVCEWLFDTVAGIRVEGERHFVINPLPGGTLSYAKAQHTSIYGTVLSSWEKQGDTYQFMIEIPCNTTAKVILPDGTSYKVESGQHIFEMK